MAQKQTIIEFGTRWIHDFEVWTDLAAEQIASVEGITGVNTGKTPSGSWVVWFDPRYDIEDIKDELSIMAVLLDLDKPE